MSTASPAISAKRVGDSADRLNDLTVNSEFAQRLRSAGIDSLEALFQLEGDRLDKPGLAPWRQRLRVHLGSRGSPPMVAYLKRYVDPPAAATRQVARASNGPRSLAEHEWRSMVQLARDGIHAVQPIAFGHQLIGRRERRSAVLTAAVPGESLEALAARWTLDDRSFVQSLIRPLADLVARFHGLGYVHRDLYLSHIFLDRGRPVDEAFRLIDVQRVMRPRWRSGRWIVKDLAALNFSAPRRLVSRTDRVRWLKHYLQTAKLDAAARRLAYRVLGKTLSIQRHERSRVLSGRATPSTNM
jgi:hypothetical protein